MAFIEFAIMKQLSNEPWLCPEDECSGCGACCAVCEKSAITMQENREGFRYPQIDRNICISCGACSKVCHALNPPELHSRQDSVFAAWASNPAFRNNSASGGIASILADHIISTGGVATGVVFDKDFSVVMELLDSQEDIGRSRGSKYVEVIMDGIHAKVKEALKNGQRVIFIGSPCQVASILCTLGDRLRKNLITCDLICHGIPSSGAWRHYFARLRNLFPNRTISDFLFRDIKHQRTMPILCFSDDSIMKLPHNLNSFTRAFLKNYSLRPVCYQCRYSQLQRVGDFSIGDFWGIEKQKGFSRIREGISFLSVNTAKGKSLLDEVGGGIASVPEALEFAVPGNEHLCHSCAKPEGRDRFYRDFFAMNEAELIRKYHLYPTLIESLLTLPQRVIRRIARMIFR